MKKSRVIDFEKYWQYSRRLSEYFLNKDRFRRLLSIKKQSRFLSNAALLEDVDSQRLSLLVIGTIGAIVFGFIIFSVVIHIDEVSLSSGEVVPSGPVHIIQHLEGGIVKKVNVQEGQEVSAGQEIVVLDDTSTRAELEQMQAKEISLKLDMERLQGFLSEVFNQKVMSDNPLLKNKKSESLTNKPATQLFDVQWRLLQLQNQRRQEQQGIVLSQIEQKKQQVSQTDQKIQTLEKNVTILRKQTAMYEILSKSSTVPKVLYLERLRDLNKAEGDLTQARSEQENNYNAISELRFRLKELDTGLYQTAMEQLNETVTNLLQVQQTVQRLQDRLQRLTIYSPVKGIVKALKPAPGSVIAPGGALVEIVPTDKPLLVEAKIAPKDIGHILVGSPVNLKISAYDFARYGMLQGRIKLISPSTFLDEYNHPYYKGIVVPNEQFLLHNNEKLKLLPGMTVQVDIITGNKSLFSYLLKPIYAATQTSFHER